MQIDLDPEGRKVVIFGDVIYARLTLRRFLGSGATVTLAAPGPLPASLDRIATVRYAVQPEATDTVGLMRLIGPAWLIVDVGLPEASRRRITDLASICGWVVASAAGLDADVPSVVGKSGVSRS
jgi:uroporphyrin-III C-methyltransferase